MDRSKLGQILKDNNLVNEQDLLEAVKLQKIWGTKLGQTLVALGKLKSSDLYKSLAKQFGLPFINLTGEIDPEILEQGLKDTYIKYNFIPFRLEDGYVCVAISDPESEAKDWCLQKYGRVRFYLTSKLDLSWCFQTYFKEISIIKAQDQLFNKDHNYSAKFIFGRKILINFILFILSLAALFFFTGLTALFYINFFIHITYFLVILFKIVVSYEGASSRFDNKVSAEELASLSDAELPIYTILLPLYKEKDSLPILINAIKNLDYPFPKLDVKIILEEDDLETIEEAQKLKLEHFFEIVVVPHTELKTKPKAMNYALQFVRGEFLTIFDGEDEPEPDQLKKAYIAFRKSRPEIVCLQARLNYYNKDENVLTRLFCIEYSHWFDYLLPGLEYQQIPIPLGGTSNHFKTSVLIDILGWDPYNVTEDADLGMRLAQKGYSVGTLNSTTFEESPVNWSVWFKQRTRWNKGYLATYLVYMRSPIKLLSEVGLKAFLGFQFFIGGSLFLNALNPIFYVIFGLWLFDIWLPPERFFPPSLLYFGFFNLLIGNLMMIYFGVVGILKRKNLDLLMYTFLNPFYWFIQSLTTYRAIFQIFFKPHKWEKTTHGISKAAKVKRNKILSGFKT